MKHCCLLAVLMLLSPAAYADSFSFSVGGHRVHIEASRRCRSPSCASVSISRNYRSRDRYFQDDDGYPDDRYGNDRMDGPPVKPHAAPPAAAPSPPPASNPPVSPPVVVTPPSLYKPAAAATQIVAAPPPPVARPAEPASPLTQIARVSHDANEDDDTPIGDWRTEGKGTVRISKCGKALCGYVLSSSSSESGEAVLINMKPKSERHWTGSVYSHHSGDTYFGTIELKGANTLRVKACALGRFYCSGNKWSRITDRPESLISSRQASTDPRS
jgi:hypothetical protein